MSSRWWYGLFNRGMSPPPPGMWAAACDVSRHAALFSSRLSLACCWMATPAAVPNR